MAIERAMTEMANDATARFAVERDFAAVRSEWDDLADAVNAPPFSRAAWFETWWDAFGEGELVIATLRRGDALAAVLPLRRSAQRLEGLTNWHTPGYAATALDHEAERDLLEGVFSLPARRIDLNMLAPDLTELDAVRSSAETAGRPMLARTIMLPPYISLDGTWDEYEASLSRARRKSLRRSRRRLELLGDVTFEVLDGTTSGVADALRDVFAVERAGWKGEQGTAMSCAADTQRFYTGIAAWAASADMLRLAFLRLDGRPIACDYALEHAGRWYSMKAGYDEEFRRFGPGALLLHAELRHAFDVGLTSFDLLGDTDEFKSSWARERSERLMVQAFHNSVAGRLEHAALTAKNRARPAFRAVKSRFGAAGAIGSAAELLSSVSTASMTSATPL